MLPSPVAQLSRKKGEPWGLPWWLSGKRIHLPVQRARAQRLVRDDPTGGGAAQPVGHDCGACAPGPGTRDEHSHCNEAGTRP